MALARLVYVSRTALEPTGQAFETELSRILKSSLNHNARLDLTGVLTCDRGVFIQALEGSPAILTQRFGQISQDPRHTDVEMINFTAVTARLFADWPMGFVEVSARGQTDGVRGALHSRTSPEILAALSVLAHSAGVRSSIGSAA